MNWERTSDLNKLKTYAIGDDRYTWGLPVNFFEIKEYAILAYHPWESINGNIRVGVPDKHKIQYHGWVDDVNTNQSWNTLDEAIAGCMAYKYEGPNHRAGYYFMKMLNKQNL